MPRTDHPSLCRLQPGDARLHFRQLGCEGAPLGAVVPRRLLRGEGGLLPRDEEGQNGVGRLHHGAVELALHGGLNVGLELGGHVAGLQSEGVAKEGASRGNEATM